MIFTVIIGYNSNVYLNGGVIMKKTLAVLIVALLSLSAFASINIGTGLVIHATNEGDGKLALPGASLKAEIPICNYVGLSFNAQLALLGYGDMFDLFGLDLYVYLFSDPDLVSVKLLVPVGLLFNSDYCSPETVLGDMHTSLGLGLELSAPLSENLSLAGTFRAVGVQNYPADLYVPGIFEYFIVELGVIWSL